MCIEMYGQQFEFIFVLNEYVEIKLKWLGKYFDQYCEICVQLLICKLDYYVDVSVNVFGQILYVDVSGLIMYVVIDILVDKFDCFVIKYKEKKQQYVLLLLLVGDNEG